MSMIRSIYIINIQQLKHTYGPNLAKIKEMHEDRFSDAITCLARDQHWEEAMSG